MGSENHHHHPLHHFYHNKNLHVHHRSTFLPMLCSRPSIKDVSLPQCRGRARSFSNDLPLSPRIGCTGQVKRHNKIAGLPILSHRLSLTPKSNTTTTTTTTISTSPVVKYSKLKRLFSTKNFSTTTTAAVPPTASSCGSRPQSQSQVTLNSAVVPRKHRCSRSENIFPISVENMDPPLPVIKRLRTPEEQGQVDSLWKRRSGGAALRSLQLQQIHHPRHQLQVTSV